METPSYEELEQSVIFDFLVFKSLFLQEWNTFYKGKFKTDETFAVRKKIRGIFSTLPNINDEAFWKLIRVLGAISKYITAYQTYLKYLR